MATFKRKFQEILVEASKEGRAVTTADVERLKRELNIGQGGSKEDDGNERKSKKPRYE